jgi:enterochelin esterase-like enzyme
MEVPYWWSDELVKILEENKVNVTYNKYPGANHNLQPSWNEAIANTINFYDEKLK